MLHVIMWLPIGLLHCKLCQHSVLEPNLLTLLHTGTIGLNLLWSKFYLLFFPEFPKNFTYYFLFLYAPYYSHNYAHLVTVAK